MLKIRLSRVGRRNDHTFRLLVCEHTRPAQTGNYVEQVGSYNPHTKAKIFQAERIKYWMSNGATPTDTAHNMLVSAGVIEGKVIKKTSSKKVKKKK
jgi:small subunit ribosomal protein S16